MSSSSSNDSDQIIWVCTRDNDKLNQFDTASKSIVASYDLVSGTNGGFFIKGSIEVLGEAAINLTACI